MRILIALMILTSSLTLHAQMQGIPGTLNQIEADPAEKNLQHEYDDLRKTIDDLDKPGAPQKEEERERELRSNQVQGEPYENRIEAKDQ